MTEPGLVLRPGWEKLHLFRSVIENQTRDIPVLSYSVLFSYSLIFSFILQPSFYSTPISLLSYSSILSWKLLNGWSKFNLISSRCMINRSFIGQNFGDFTNERLGILSLKELKRLIVSFQLKVPGSKALQSRPLECLNIEHVFSYFKELLRQTM